MQRRWLNEHRQCRLIEWIMNRILIFFSIATLSTPPLALIAPPEHDEALCRLFFFLDGPWVFTPMVYNASDTFCPQKQQYLMTYDIIKITALAVNASSMLLQVIIINLINYCIRAHFFLLRVM